MLVATFGPTTAWAGKTITWDGNQFVLEGYGRIPGSALVDYDQQGHLQWASAELRSWAWAYAHWEASGSPGAQAATQTQAVAQPLTAAQPWATAQPHAAARPTGAKRPFPVWAIVLIVVGAVVLAAGPLTSCSCRRPRSSVRSRRLQVRRAPRPQRRVAAVFEGTHTQLARP